MSGQPGLSFDPIGAITGRMFMGTVDDSVSRHPWLSIEPDLETLNRTLIFHALLGPRLCCRIGNILYHDPYLRGLLEPDTSPLIPLAKTGFLQFHMRGATINDTVDLRLEEQTNSTITFAEKHEWKMGAGMFYALDEIDKQLPYGVGKKQYRPQFRETFNVMMSSLTPNVRTQFGKVHEQWARLEPQKRTRSEFEKLALAKFPDSPLAVSNAMSVINAVNHYAYGVGMIGSEENTIPFIDTRELSVLSGYTRSTMSENEKIDLELLDQLIEGRALDTIRRHLQIPARLLRDPMMWQRFALLLDQNNRLSKEFFEHKAETLFAIKRLLQAPDVSRRTNELTDACRRYSRFLSSALESKSERSVSPIYKLFVRMAGSTGESGASEFLSNEIKFRVGDFAVAAGHGALTLSNAVAGLFVSFGIRTLGPTIRRKIDEFGTGPSPTRRDEIIRQHQPILGSLCIKQIDTSIKPS